MRIVNDYRAEILDCLVIVVSVTNQFYVVIASAPSALLKVINFVFRTGRHLRGLELLPRDYIFLQLLSMLSSLRSLCPDTNGSTVFYLSIIYFLSTVNKYAPYFS